MLGYVIRLEVAKSELAYIDMVNVYMRGKHKATDMRAVESSSSTAILAVLS